MGWTVGTDLEAHRAAVAPFLDLDPVGVTGQGTLLAAVAAGATWSDDPPVFAVHRDAAGRVDAAALRTPPHPLHLDGTADPAELVPALVTALDGHDLSGINAPEPLARAFAAAWIDAHPATVREHHRNLLLALPGPDALTAPSTDPGGTTARPATTDDLPRIRELHAAMRAEIGETGPVPARILPDRLAAGLLWVIGDADDPVAMANASLPAVGVSRVAGVYIAPSWRGRGYAAVVTAAVSRAAYAAGAEHVCLYTDAANPISNGVYERLGYVRRPDDRLVLVFGAA